MIQVNASTHFFDTRQVRRVCDRRIGGTLIDVAVGSMLLSLLLIPSMQLISKSQMINLRLDDREAMLFEAEQVLEMTKIRLSDPATFGETYNRPIDDVSRRSVNGTSQYLVRLQVYPDRSLASELLTIEVSLWRDTDRDGRLDATETSESLRTQWASP